MPANTTAAFQQFLESIALGERQIQRMDSAASAIKEFLLKSYGLPANTVFLQGSYPNGTAVEPVDGGEYDIDVVAVCVGQGTSANAALDDLFARFRADGRYEPRAQPKKPCVRLEYAEDEVGAFHVDVVPTRASATGAAPLDAPRRNDGWKPTVPAEYTNWCRAQGNLYARTVMMLKRWRAEQQSVRNAIKSIVLQVLVAPCIAQIADDATRMAFTFRALHDQFSQLQEPPVVPNPVLASENLAASWTQESFESFVRELAEAREWAEKALATEDPVEATDLWREIFGDDFPTASTSALGIQLGDYSHAQSPEEMGWTVQLDPRYQVTVTATIQRGKRQQNRRAYRSDGPLIFARHRLHFNARVVATRNVEVWWQVANTGAHAQSLAALRGEIFKGRDLEGVELVDQTQNWESTAYTGSHLIRALLVRDRCVLATSEWFVVNIYARGRAFHF